MPLLWKVLANKYHGKIQFASARDLKGRVSKQMGFEPGSKKESKVIVFRKDGKDAVLYKGPSSFPDTLHAFLTCVQGVMKYEPLVEFMDALFKDEVDVTQHAVGDEQLVLKAEEEAKAAKDAGVEEEEEDDEDEDGKKKKKTKKAGGEL